MVASRSAPKATVVPMLVDDDVGKALEDMPFRQYTAEDLGGRWWTFSQNIRDVEPSAWGATVAK